MLRSLVGSEMCIRDRYQRRVRGLPVRAMFAPGGFPHMRPPPPFAFHAHLPFQPVPRPVMMGGELGGIHDKTGELKMETEKLTPTNESRGWANDRLKAIQERINASRENDRPVAPMLQSPGREDMGSPEQETLSSRQEQRDQLQTRIEQQLAAEAAHRRTITETLPVLPAHLQEPCVEVGSGGQQSIPRQSYLPQWQSQPVEMTNEARKKAEARLIEETVEAEAEERRHLGGAPPTVRIMSDEDKKKAEQRLIAEVVAAESDARRRKHGESRHESAPGIEHHKTNQRVACDHESTLHEPVQPPDPTTCQSQPVHQASTRYMRDRNHFHCPPGGSGHLDPHPPAGFLPESSVEYFDPTLLRTLAFPVHGSNPHPHPNTNRHGTSVFHHGASTSAYKVHGSYGSSAVYGVDKADKSALEYQALLETEQNKSRILRQEMERSSSTAMTATAMPSPDLARSSGAMQASEPVSYTHLTLPTKRIV
eukprot:TRINITY_DN23448_c0_g1_i2.p1 TRINITY_DN23448_c0_g1~~TRINITY_DN23448_c0_g1_i2.p1  ORF type:complete len:517 (-),score=82.49 TRINITY_DN23448_c0_g1_i2:90-1529(-)